METNRPATNTETARKAIESEAERKHAEIATPRTPHLNAEDTAGTTHRVDIHGRAMCDETIHTDGNVARRVTCRACIDTMYPGNDQRNRSRRDEWYAAAEAEEGRQIAAQLLSGDVTDRHMGERIDIGDRDNPMVRAFRATVMDELHTRAFAEEGRRRAAELIALGLDERAIGGVLDFVDRDNPLVGAFRAALMDALHTKATSEYAARLDRMPIGPPPIAVGDTVFVASQPGRWTVDDIHFGRGDVNNPRHVPQSDDRSFVTVSQVEGGGNGYPYATELRGWARSTVLTIHNPHALTFVRRGNALADELMALGLDYEEVITPSDNVIKNGTITTVQAIRAAADAKLNAYLASKRTE